MAVKQIMLATFAHVEHDSKLALYPTAWSVSRIITKASLLELHMWVRTWPSKHPLSLCWILLNVYLDPLVCGHDQCILPSVCTVCPYEHVISGVTFQCI